MRGDQLLTADRFREKGPCPAGYLNLELFSFMGPIVVLIYAIGAGASAIAGEEDRRTLDLLLVNTVSRGRVVLEKMAAIVFGTAVLVIVLRVALLVEGRIAGMDVPIANSAASLTPSDCSVSSSARWRCV